MVAEKDIKALEESLRFAQRASVLIKTPQCKEIFKMMKDRCCEYNNKIINKKPQEYDDYLFTLGKTQALLDFMNHLTLAAERKEEYAERLKRYKELH